MPPPGRFMKINVNLSHVPPSRHCVIVRGLPHFVIPERIRDTFYRDCGRCKVQDVRTKTNGIIVVLRFEQTEHAGMAISRFNAWKYKGRYKLSVDWFRDVLKYHLEQQQQIMATRPYDARSRIIARRRMRSTSILNSQLNRVRKRDWSPSSTSSSSSSSSRDARSSKSGQVKRRKRRVRSTSEKPGDHVRRMKCRVQEDSASSSGDTSSSSSCSSSSSSSSSTDSDNYHASRRNRNWTSGSAQRGTKHRSVESTTYFKSSDEACSKSCSPRKKVKTKELEPGEIDEESDCKYNYGRNTFFTQRSRPKAKRFNHTATVRKFTKFSVRGHRRSNNFQRGKLPVFSCKNKTKFPTNPESECPTKCTKTYSPVKSDENTAASVPKSCESTTNEGSTSVLSNCNTVSGKVCFTDNPEISCSSGVITKDKNVRDDVHYRKTPPPSIVSFDSTDTSDNEGKSAQPCHTPVVPRQPQKPEDVTPTKDELGDYLYTADNRKIPKPFFLRFAPQRLKYQSPLAIFSAQDDALSDEEDKMCDIVKTKRAPYIKIFRNAKCVEDTAKSDAIALPHPVGCDVSESSKKMTQNEKEKENASVLTKKNVNSEAAAEPRESTFDKSSISHDEMSLSNQEIKKLDTENPFLDVEKDSPASPTETLDKDSGIGKNGEKGNGQCCKVSLVNQDVPSSIDSEKSTASNANTDNLSDKDTPVGEKESADATKTASTSDVALSTPEKTSQSGNKGTCSPKPLTSYSASSPSMTSSSGSGKTMSSPFCRRLSSFQLRRIERKKNLLQETFQSDSKTICDVAKLLMSKDPSLKETIAKSIQKTLLDMGETFVKQLEDYIHHVASYDHHSKR